MMKKKKKEKENDHLNRVQSFNACTSISNSPRNTQIPNLLQYLLNPVIQITPRILISRLRIQILLYLRHTRVSLCTKAQLDFNESFETRIKVGHTQIDELGQFIKQLFVELFVCLLSDFGFALGSGQFCSVLVGLFDETLYFGAHCVVVEEFVIALFDTFVDVWEVGAEAGDWV